MESGFLYRSMERYAGDGSLAGYLVFWGYIFIPESPRWLILRRHTESAHRILKRIYGSDEMAGEELNATREVVKSATKSEWKLILKPGILKAVLIGVGIAILGQFMGVNAVLYYGPAILKAVACPEEIPCFTR